MSKGAHDILILSTSWTLRREPAGPGPTVCGSEARPSSASRFLLQAWATLRPRAAPWAGAHTPQPAQATPGQPSCTGPGS